MKNDFSKHISENLEQYQLSQYIQQKFWEVFDKWKLSYQFPQINSNKITV